MWEIRLNDEKRQAIAAGDQITFSRRPDNVQTTNVVVEERLTFQNLQRLLDKIPLEEIGSYQNELDFIQTFMTHYRQIDMVQHGVVALKIKKI